ncbi:HetZ-related protein [Leptolyngbya sp. NK1-12]|uniref:HetZ-related protein n=1 Tax=Leptolyngbya sp. NK1-12 TaxID=2547451 RepID=A0AA97AFA9_9CYAN|nr:HetZ-related protein [Leptolyngbya sp. NK1-12]WNZ22094.1 HetZ-related protein [Leptolyngbya sp. NK1-12]
MNVEPVNSASSPNSNDHPSQPTEIASTGVPSSELLKQPKSLKQPESLKQLEQSERSQRFEQPSQPTVLQPETLATSSNHAPDPLQDENQTLTLVQQILTEYQAELPALSASVRAVVTRIAVEVVRICSKSDRIYNSGEVQFWQMKLARLRMQKCLNYYRLGSRQGRVELMSHLSTMVYRHIAPHQSQLGFSARYNAIEDFLQGFNVEVLKAFRRENGLDANYCPKTRLELAEYMAFTEQYAKRHILLPGQRKQQLIVLRAQGYAQRQPPEAVLDLELAMDSAKGEEAEMHSRSAMMQQVREQMVAETVDPADSVIRDRVITELIEYLEEQGQPDCVEYLILKLKDLSAPEIDDLLGLSPRQRDYLQQRFKYHVEKFARSHRWQLVHQWLGADLDQNLGMTQQQWDLFLSRLTPDLQQLLQLKSKQLEDQEIAKILKCTPVQVRKRWVKLLNLAWEARNSSTV